MQQWPNLEQKNSTTRALYKDISILKWGLFPLPGSKLLKMNNFTQKNISITHTYISIRAFCCLAAACSTTVKKSREIFVLAINLKEIKPKGNYFVRKLFSKIWHHASYKKILFIKNLTDNDEYCICVGILDNMGREWEVILGGAFS